ncbi:MAG: hypothetical protein HY543_07285 [Deltaproteobacteria bacterium]|nr:hypothetical protein [Deltaproteobacteria bacterium]
MTACRRRERGFSIIGTVLTLLALAGFGGAVVGIVAEEQDIRGAEYNASRAFYTAMAGLEYGLREVTTGGFPNVTNKGFAFGTFTTAVDPVARTLTATGNVGGAQRRYRVTIPQLAGDCAAVDGQGANPVGPAKDEINRVKLRKSCMSAVRIDRTTVSWVPDGGQRLQRLEYDGDVVYDNPTGVNSGIEVDHDDIVIMDGSEHQFSRLIFTADITETTMTVMVRFSDGSTSTTTFEL